LLGSVLDDFVSVSQLGNVIVAAEFISKDGSFIPIGDVLGNHRQQSSGFNIGDYLCDCASALRVT